MDTYASNAIVDVWDPPLSAWINYIRPVFMNSKPVRREEVIGEGNFIQFVGQGAQFYWEEGIGCCPRLCRPVYVPVPALEFQPFVVAML